MQVELAEGLLLLLFLLMPLCSRADLLQDTLALAYKALLAWLSQLMAEQFQSLVDRFEVVVELRSLKPP